MSPRATYIPGKNASYLPWTAPGTVLLPLLLQSRTDSRMVMSPKTHKARKPQGGHKMFRSTSIVATALLVAVSIGQGNAFSSPASLLSLRCSIGAPQGRGGGKEAGIRVGGDGSSAASLGRRAFLLGAGLVAGSAPASAADGLFGAQVGWGEKKAAGIKWDGGFANPLGSQPDDFLFEVVNGNGTPVVLSFQKPKKWKVSTNAGITIQDYISADSGFILVAPLPEGKSDIAGVDPSYMLDKVFDIRGRYGTYGKVDSMTVTLDKTVEEGGRKYKYIDFKFTTLSPGSREIDRNGCIKVTAIDGDIVMLIASSNANRWKKQKEVIASTITTFSAAPAPKTSMKQIESGIGNLAALGVAGYDLLRYDSPIWTSR